jgi:23S rRNA (adenine2503-C2)-methyltransferase
MKPPSHHLFQFTPDSLAEWGAQRGMPRFRAKQILEWVYDKNVIDPAQMTNLSAGDRLALAREMVFESGETIATQEASDGVRKLLIEWNEYGADGAPERPALPILGQTGDATRQTECVMIPATSEAGRERRTACISSQVGCPVGCRFCASGLGGLDGNLSGGRIVEQVWRLGNLPGVGRITNIVFMGMGEPLANFAAVKHAIEVLSAPWGLGISGRKITVSTVGLPKAIEKLAREIDTPVTLALSLHAPTDELRRKLIPWSSYTTIAELTVACDVWFQKTGREITLEYTLMGGVNDSPTQAKQLAQITRRLRANVNLLRYNEVEGLPFKRPEGASVRRFQDVLRESGVNVHIRASRGRDISAACGQLRHEKAGAV